MTIERKLLGTSPSGGPTDVAEVFSTYLYTGTGSAQTITNGIDLAGEGGLVWIKERSNVESHILLDFTRDLSSRSYYLMSNDTTEDSMHIPAHTLNNDGFDISAASEVNSSGEDYASWTFRKKKKFFDVVTWSGDNSTNRQISHSLSGPVGMIILKCTSHASNWTVFHTSLGGTKRLVLNRGDISVQTSQEYWNNTNPTSTNFTVGGSGDNNATGRTYVAYLFADNSAEDAEDQMIKCGSYTGTGASVGASVTLGWEPQFVLVKAATAAGSWAMMDTMRGIPNDADNPTLFADTNAAEVSQANWLEINSTGFKTLNGNYANGNASGVTYIYMAIRAPMMVEPEAATDVFHVDTNNNSDNPTVNAPFPIDTYIYKDTTGGAALTASRLTQGERLQISSTGASSVMAQYVFDYQNAAHAAVLGVNLYNYAWKRAKGYFDVVCYKGTGVGGRTQAHSLGVAPEMMWVRRRDGGGGNWMVYHTGMGNTSRVVLNSASQLGTSITYWNDTSPTDSVFTVGSSSDVNASNLNFISYHFATLDGISKVGSYTGNGSNQTIDCGFSAGSRFILIRRTNVSTSNWYVWDSVRGIVAGNDPHYNLNDSTAQVTNDDSVDPHNSGFIVNQVSATNINVSSHTYIFYAIA